MSNRLNLNFSLDSMEERRDFLDTYLAQEVFTTKPLTEKELETCANYILWGKDSNGQNFVQSGEGEIERKNSSWSSTVENESLDALLEQPTFSETSLHPLSSVPTRIKRTNFDREKALQEAPDYLKPIFSDLFKRIYTLEAITAFYDYNHGKRKEPPSTTLLSHFTLDEQLDLSARADTLTQKQYLQMRHERIELCNEQFTLRDSYVPLIQKTTPSYFTSIDTTSDIEADIPVYPLGILGNQKIHSLIFQDEFIPESFTEEELQKISDFLWQKESKRPSVYIDFCDPKHVYELFLMFYELEDAGAAADVENNTSNLVRTLEYYCMQAKLNDIQREILVQKMCKIGNQEIAKSINHQFGKTYSANYISTIFCQKIVPAINNAAANHLKIIQNIFFPENFKRCTLCGRMFLIDEYNFVHKARSKDGFANRCKACDKIERERKQNYVSKFN